VGWKSAYPGLLVNRDFRKVLEKVGLPKLRFHDLRHVHASWLLKHGIHPKIVQE
jgi:integrase